MNSNLQTLSVDTSVKIGDVLRIFTESTSDLLLIDSHAVVTTPHLELLTDYPRSVTTALVAPKVNGDVRVTSDRIQSAGSDFHQVTAGNHTSLGIIRLSQRQRAEVIDVLTKIEKSGKNGSTVDLILVGLVRAALMVAPAILVGAPYVRSEDPSVRAKVKTEIDSLNESRLRLKMANRANDGFFSVFFLRKFSKLGTWAAVRLKMTPNQVTLISFAVGILSAYEFSHGKFWPTLLGALLLQLSIIIDCVDGELARYTRQFSQLGAWLDAITDRIKEYLVYFALAYGAEKNGHNLWIPAIGMMLFQTFRHISDYNFARVNKIRESNLTPVDFLQASDSFVPKNTIKLGRLRYWLKKMVQFPIGERWLVISATSVIGGARFTFIAMPILSLISIAVVFRGRVIKTHTWNRERVNKPLIDNQIDIFTKGASLTRYDWLEPSLLRLLEGGIYIWLTQAFDLNTHEIFIVIFAILFGHYDSMYRALASEKKPRWLDAVGLYIPGRVAVIAAFAIAGFDLTALVYYFGGLYFVVASIQWVISNFAKGR